MITIEFGVGVSRNLPKPKKPTKVDERERESIKVNPHVGHLDSKINKVESGTSKWAWHHFQRGDIAYDHKI